MFVVFVGFTVRVMLSGSASHGPRIEENFWVWVNVGSRVESRLIWVESRARYFDRRGVSVILLFSKLLFG